MLVPLVQELRTEGLEQVLPMAIEGDPAGEIIDLANTTPNSLIAMSTHGRSGIGRCGCWSASQKKSFSTHGTPCFSSGRLETHPLFSIASPSARKDSRAVCFKEGCRHATHDC
jgi:hypothetical protein